MVPEVNVKFAKRSDERMLRFVRDLGKRADADDFPPLWAGLFAATDGVENILRSTTPVDTGRLRASVKRRTFYSEREGKAIVAVGYVTASAGRGNRFRLKRAGRTRSATKPDFMAAVAGAYGSVRHGPFLRLMQTADFLQSVARRRYARAFVGSLKGELKELAKRNGFRVRG